MQARTLSKTSTWSATLLAVLLFGTTAYAKSIADVRRDAAREAGGARIEPAGTYSESRERINGVVTLVGQFPVRLVSNVAGHTGVTRVAACTAQYYDNRYNTLLIGEIHLEGMPDLDLNALGMQLTSVLEQPRYHGDRVIAFDGVSRIPDAHQTWTALNAVQVPLRLQYRRQIQRNQGAENVLETVQDDVQLMMRNSNEEGTGTWSLAGLVPIHQTVAATTPVVGPPGTLLPTWQERAFLNRLERNHIEPQNFQSAEAACRFTYDLMRSDASEERLYFTIVQIWDAGRFTAHGRPFPTPAGEAYLQRLIATRARLRAFPASLTVEEHDDHPMATYEARAHGHAPPPPSNPNRVYFSGGANGHGQCEARRVGDGPFMMWEWDIN